MKQKNSTVKFLLFGLTFFFGAFSLFSTGFAAEKILVIGDSIAVGVADRIDPTKTSASVGASSAEIARMDGSGTFTQMIISAGSNDPTSQNLAANLRAIRAKQPNATAVWILPYNASARATVQSVAASFGDSTVDLSSFPAASDGIHPASYAQVATAVQGALTTTGGAPTPPTTAPPTTTGGTGTSAGLVICGLNNDNPATLNIDETLPCTACHLLLMGDSIIDWMTRVMTIIAIAFIFAMGVLYIVSAGNEKMISQAKAGIKASLIGFAVILSAWLIVNTVLRIASLSDTGPLANFKNVSTFTFTCNTASNAGTAGNTSFGSGSGSGTGGSSTGGTSYSGSGTCQPVTNSSSNPCSTSNLASTCFGGNSVNSWSAICQAESNGNAAIPSSVDICADGNAASFGLFQINITANKVDGLDCPAAFSGGAYTASNHSCRVINMTLYNQCKAAATTASKNIATACRLSGNGTNTGPWGAARRCNIPRSL